MRPVLEIISNHWAGLGIALCKKCNNDVTEIYYYVILRYIMIYYRVYL